jgi:hypothetical protein
MASNDKKTGDAAAKKEPAAVGKITEAVPKAEGAKTEAAKVEGAKAETAKVDAPKADAPKADTAKADTPPARKGMGEGQKPVTQAYKDNWNAIFGKKKKRWWRALPRHSGMVR